MGQSGTESPKLIHLRDFGSVATIPIAKLLATIHRHCYNSDLLTSATDSQIRNVIRILEHVWQTWYHLRNGILSMTSGWDH